MFIETVKTTNEQNKLYSDFLIKRYRLVFVHTDLYLLQNVAGFGSEIKSLQANVESLMKVKADLQMSTKNMEERIKKLEVRIQVS